MILEVILRRCLYCGALDYLPDPPAWRSRLQKIIDRAMRPRSFECQADTAIYR